MGTIKSLTFFVVKAVANYTKAILSTVSFPIVALLSLELQSWGCGLPTGRMRLGIS